MWIFCNLRVNLELLKFQENFFVNDTLNFLNSWFGLAAILRTLETIVLHLVLDERAVEFLEALSTKFVTALSQHFDVYFLVIQRVRAVADSTLKLLTYSWVCHHIL